MLESKRYYMNRVVSFKHWGICLCFLLVLAGCRQELPVTSTIEVDFALFKHDTPSDLYGISLDEIDHAIEGGIYAEMIQNRSFEDGVAPINCRYDRKNQVIVTPNGFQMPFIKPDSIVGWKTLSKRTWVFLDDSALINTKNKRSLYVAIRGGDTIRGGVAAQGYNGLSIKAGERYQLSLYLKSAYTMRNALRIVLQQDSTLLSNAMEVTPTKTWNRYTYQFTATKDASEAALTITSDSAAVFWMDVVSLFPEKTFKGRKNGMRADLMEKISALKPSFIRYPAGEFLNGYTAGSYPQWEQTIGDIASRKHFWSGAGYGISNGFGYDEFLQLCEDLDAKPIYVVNSGITSQSRRPRYEEIKNMDKLVEQTLAAIAYANAPVDSLQGMLRAKNGHPEPYNLKCIEIGSNNFGPEYIRRLNYFKTAIQQLDSSIQVIATERLSLRYPNMLTDRSFGADNSFLIGEHDLFNYKTYPRQQLPLLVSGFSSVENRAVATMEHAIAEAAFMIGMEKNPDRVKRIAYTPLLTNARYADTPYGALLFNGDSILATPSYYAFQLFATHANGEVLETRVLCDSKPQVTAGAIGFYLFDNAFEIDQVTINGSLNYDKRVKQGEWNTASHGKLIPAPNRWNYLLIGDSTAYNYELQAQIMRTKGSGEIEIRLRDNAEMGASASYIALNLGASTSTLTRYSGTARQVLAESMRPITFNNNETYRIRLHCKHDTLRTYLNDELLHEHIFPPKPYLLALAKYKKEAGEIVLKVVNTSYRPERTALDFHKIEINEVIQAIQLKANNLITNTLDNPNAVVPTNVNVSSGVIDNGILEFPPQSISVIRLKVTVPKE